MEVFPFGPALGDLHLLLLKVEKKSDNRAFCADGKFPFYAETMKEEDVSSPSFNYYLGRVKSLQIRKWVVGIIPKIIMTQFWGEGSAQKNCWWTNEDH